jgi:hypothetical protein
MPRLYELEYGALHVTYELKQVARLPGCYDRAWAFRDEPLVGATFEASLLHLRNILEFLTLKNEPDKFIRAVTYAGDAWKPKESAALGRLRTLWTPINRHVNHLSWHRVTEIQNYGNWPIREFAADAIEAHSDFVGCLEQVDPSRAAWFAPGLIEARALLEG